jgi:hypothetical protein
MKRIVILLWIFGLVGWGASVAWGQFNTSARWVESGDAVIGADFADSITLNTDGADLSLDVTANALILTATTTNSATFSGADAAAPGNTIYDTSTTGTITIGSADVTNVTVNSDVGLTFANNSDSINNLADATFDFTRNTAGAVTLTCSDDDATCAMVYDAGGAAAITVGSADVTAVTITTDSTGDAELVLPAESVSSAEILNVVRSVPLPLNSFWPCNADGTLESDDAADAFPDFGRGSGLATAMSHVIQWDVTGGSVDTEEICVTVTVPQDYFGGSTFHITFLDTTTNDHDYDEFTLLQNPDSAEDVTTATPTLGLGVGASTTTTVCDGATTAGDLFVCTWTTEAVAAGDTLVFGFGPTAGDTEALTMFGAEWRYTATQ